MKFVFRLAALGAAAVAAVSPVSLTAAHAATAPGGRAQAQSAAWPQFHYNAAHTGYNPQETILSPAAVPGLHLLWLASTHGAGTGPGSVSIRSGRAYLGGFSPPALWAWSATTGGRRWMATTDDLMESTPAVGGRRVFVESNGGILYAFDSKTGATLWTQSIGGAATSPALVNNVVYAAGYFTMNAFDAATGALLWRTALPSLVRSNPAVASGRVFVATEASRRNLLALNAATGAVLWAKTVGGVQLASPAVRDGVLYQCSATGLFALGVAHGQQHWFQPAGCSLDATPAIANGVIYTAPSQQPLQAFSASSGALLWSGGNADSVFAAAPAVADGVVYAAAGPGTIAAYDVTTHALLWTSPNLGLGESSPAVVNGRLYAADGKGLYAFGL